jgi:AraC-like DNA-binding protein
VQLVNVHFDDRIPDWGTPEAVLTYNVLVLVMEGKVRYRINGEDLIAEQGDLLYIPASTLRRGGNDEVNTHRKYTFLFTFDHNVATGIPLLDRRRFIRFRLANLEYVKRRFERLHEEMRSSERFRSFICLGIAQELIGILSRELGKPEVLPGRMQFAQTLKRYLLEHYREPIEIDQLTGLIHRTPNYTTALFKEVFGYPPIQFMHQLRVREACNLLLESDMTIAGISQYLGYYDSSYFFRMFKKHTDLTPAAFIARGRQSELSQQFE